jgi:hypothetical protein
MADSPPLCASLDRHRMMADAIILERAERVLQRRDPEGTVHDRTENTVVTFLRYRAQALRLEAEDA